MKNNLYILLLLSTLWACEQDSIATFDNRTAVVDAYLFAGRPVDSVLIFESFSYARNDSNLITLDDLEVYLSEGGETYALNNAGNGFYQNMDLTVKAGATYNLDFQFNGERISGETFVPEVQSAEISVTEIEMEKISGGFGGGFGGFLELEPIEVTWSNTAGDYYYVLVENIEEAPEYINDRLADPDFPLRRFRVITEPEVVDFYAVDPRRQITQFGTHRVVVFRVNPEYAALYQLSGASSVSITQPPSNIDNGLGIFTGVSSDTLYFEVNKL